MKSAPASVLPSVRVTSVPLKDREVAVWLSLFTTTYESVDVWYVSVLGRVAMMAALPNLVLVNVSSPVLESTATMSASELVYSIRLDKSVLSSLFVAVALGAVKPSSLPLVNVNVLPELVPKVVVVGG